MFTHIDLFAGIGGFHIGVKNNGGFTIGISEVNKPAIETYTANHGPHLNYGDIRKIDDIAYCDLLTAGVPCQSWSIAGKGLGFSDDRGQLWNDTLYLLSKSRPKAFIFENVKGLSDPRHRESLDYIMSRIKDIGYFASYYLINSYNYGVPQKRERIYIVGFNNETSHVKFELPALTIEHSTLNDILGLGLDVYGVYPDQFIFTDARGGNHTIHSWDISATHRQRHICELIRVHRRRLSNKKVSDSRALKLSDIQSIDSSVKVEELDELISLGFLRNKDDGYELKNSKISSGIKGIYRVVNPTSTVYPTLVASDTMDYLALEPFKDKLTLIKSLKSKIPIRKINKEEACVIMGYPKDFILPDNRMAWMKQIGNSVTPPIIEKLISSIISVLD